MFEGKNILTDITIDGNKIHTFFSLSICQKFNAHHTFEMEVDYAEMEVPGTNGIEKSQQYIGKNITICFGQSNTTDNTFVGIVSEIGFKQTKVGAWGHVIVKGYSPTYLMEAGEDYFSYNQKTLKDIINDKMAKAAFSDKMMVVKPLNIKPIPYLSQYKESDFRFINRLAAEYSEWFYYDGEKLFFGKPDSQPRHDLFYEIDIQKMFFSIRAIPAQVKHYSYNSAENADYEGYCSRKTADVLDSYTQHALNVSDALFPHEKMQEGSIRTYNRSQIDSYAAQQRAGKAANMVLLSGTGDNPKVKLGSIINVKTLSQGLNGTDSQLGEFMVTSITHHLNHDPSKNPKQNAHHNALNNLISDHISQHNLTLNAETEHLPGAYSAEFEAIPSSNTVIPAYVEKPVAETQVARVVKNTDDVNQDGTQLNWGRVRVQMLWQTGNDMMTDWIRVLTPDAGYNDNGEQNRGHVFVPEVGDQVLIGFRYNDPDRPFVLGGIFHGDNGVGGELENNIKAIKTRSGHKLIFDDAKGHESITIIDKHENRIFIDTNANDITISSKGSIYLSAKKNIEINAGEKLLMGSHHIRSTAGKQHMFFTGEVFENHVDGEHIMTANVSKTTVVKNYEVSTTDGPMLHQSKGPMKHHSDSHHEKT